MNIWFIILIQKINNSSPIDWDIIIISAAKIGLSLDLVRLEKKIVPKSVESAFSCKMYSVLPFFVYYIVDLTPENIGVYLRLAATGTNGIQIKIQGISLTYR